MASEPTFNPAWFVGGICGEALEEAQHKDHAAARPHHSGRLSDGLHVQGRRRHRRPRERRHHAEHHLRLHGLYHHRRATLFKCWVYPGTHGQLSLDQAIVQSCDVYFYNVGYDFYQHKGEGLEDWAKRLGMGRTTGIDIPGEVAGLVPTPEWKNDGLHQEDRPQGLADRPPLEARRLHQLAIGQGNLEATPLQARRRLRRHRQRRLPRDAAPRRSRSSNSQGQLVRRLPYTQPRSLGISQEHHRRGAERTARGGHDAGRHLVRRSGTTRSRWPARPAPPQVVRPERLRLVLQLRAGQRPQVRGGRHDPAGRPRRRHRRAGRPHDLRLAVPHHGGQATGAAHSD